MELGFAATLGDPGRVASLLAQGANPMSSAPRGFTALMQAAAAQHGGAGGSEACVALLAPVSDASARDWIGATALMRAATAGNAGALAILLPMSDPLAADHGGANAMIRAARAGSLECVEMLMGRGGELAANESGSTALICAVAACEGRSWECAMALARFGGPKLAGAAGQQGWTALMHAASGAQPQKRGRDRPGMRLEAARLLASMGGVDAASRSGETALALASEEGLSEMVELLLAAGADARLASKSGMTPLMRAASKGHARCVEMLLPHSDPWALAAGGMSAQGQAVGNGHLEAARAIGRWMAAMEEAKAVAEAARPSAPSARAGGRI